MLNANSVNFQIYSKKSNVILIFAQNARHTFSNSKFLQLLHVSKFFQFVLTKKKKQKQKIWQFVLILLKEVIEPQSYVQKAVSKG